MAIDTILIESEELFFGGRQREILQDEIQITCRHELFHQHKGALQPNDFGTPEITLAQIETADPLRDLPPTDKILGDCRLVFLEHQIIEYHQML